MFSQGEIS